MAYDNLKPVCYQFTALNYVTGAGTKKMKIPRGATMARVLDILVVATAAFTAVTTPATISIGDGTTANAFATLPVGVLAIGNTIGGSDLTNGVFTGVYLAGNYNSGAGLHDLIATIVAPTGGTPAGTGDTIVIVGYDQINT